MQPQTHAVTQRRVHLDDHLGRVERHRIDFRPGETPAVFAQADDRVDAVGADADVEDRHALAARDLAAVAGRQQIRQVVQIVGAAGDRRAQVVRRNIPVLNAVKCCSNARLSIFTAAGSAKSTETSPQAFGFTNGASAGQLAISAGKS